MSRNSAGLQAKITFGRFVFDPETRQLLGNGKPLHLSPKAFQLLQILIERGPAVVAKDVLIEKLWPDVTVEEANLKNLIAEIRAALQEGGETGELIRTVHRVGYAFTADTASGVSSYLSDGERTWQLRCGENLLGRSRDCTVVLSSAGVSRQHARIRVTAHSALLEDAGSKNGTWLNDYRVTSPVHLHNGDRIRIGVAKLIFRTGEDQEPTATLG